MASRRFSLVVAIVAVSNSCFTQSAHSQLNYTPYFYDGFNVSTNTTDINLEIDPNSGLSPFRQGGIDSPVSWVSSVDDPNRAYKVQMFGPNPDPNLPSYQPLQLAEDNTGKLVPPPEGIAPTIVSPDMDFSGTLPNGDIIGKRITFTLDVAAFTPAFDDPNYPGVNFPDFGWTFAGVSVGGETTLIDHSDSEAFVNDPNNLTPTIREKYSLNFIKDRFGLFKDFVQAWDPNGGHVYDNTGCVGCQLDHNGGDGILNIRIDIDDPNNDGDPWNGVGSTVISAYVFDPNAGNYAPITRPNQGNAPFIYEIPNGGLTSNYISFYGKAQTWSENASLSTHHFDDFTVWSAPAFESTDDADFDGDGVVTGLDFLIYQQNIGLGGQVDNSNGDANGDGLVGTADLAIWQNQYQTSPFGAAVSVVPEPASVGLLSLASLGVLLQRKRY